MGQLQEKYMHYREPQKFMEAGVYPYFREITGKQGTEVEMGGHKVLMFGSNAYTGLTGDQRIIDAAKRALDQYGSGCAGSRFLNGTLDLHVQLEKEISKFIINPISGTQKKDDFPELIDQMLDHSQFDIELRFTEYRGHAAEIARQSADQGIDIVVAVGGDGTVNEVARSLVHTNTALGIIPCGSGNGLARHLCIPMDIHGALQLINNCAIDTFDYGLINGLPFFCTCGMGFDAFISLKFAEAGKRGPITYIENVLKEGLRYRPETYEIVDETGTTRYRAFLIACANASQYGNNAYIAPGATMRDGMMDVIVMEPFDALEAPQIAADLFMKTLGNNSKIKTFRTKHIHIHRTEPGAIHYDGDPIMTGTDIDVSIEAQGIHIITNPNAPEDKAQPNQVLNAFSDFFNNINNVREDITDNIEKGGRKIQAINKVLLRKLRS